jgi:hypothetical protein
MGRDSVVSVKSMDNIGDEHLTVERLTYLKEIKMVYVIRKILERRVRWQFLSDLQKIGVSLPQER